MNKDVIGTAIERIKDMVRQGNVSRIIVRKDSRVVVDIPVNVGVGVGVVGLLAAKWVVIAGLLATVGVGCTIEVVKNDSEIVQVVSEDNADKVHAAFSNVADTVKDEVKDMVNKL